jgi:hypothetical protein
VKVSSIESQQYLSKVQIQATQEVHLVKYEIRTNLHRCSSKTVFYFIALCKLCFIIKLHAWKSELLDKSVEASHTQLQQNLWKVYGIKGEDSIYGVTKTGLYY